jgi:hypothetical protein
VERQYVASRSDKMAVLHFARKISSWIMLYGQVLDVLSQHHPEYLALAWGSVKFILMVRISPALIDRHSSDSGKGVLSHETITTQICQALQDISDVLPRMELHLKLYPTERMQENMARLYAHMLLFLRQAVKWFSHNSARRVLSAVFQPFELKHKGLIDGIRTCAGAIDQEASASSKAEIRGSHIEVRRNGQRIADLDQKIDANHKGHEARLDLIDTKLDDIRVKIKEVTHRVTDVQGTVRDTRARVVDLQLNEVMSTLKPKTLPEEAFRKQRALVRRGTPWVDDNQETLEMIQKIGVWICKPETPLLVLQAGPRAQASARELAIELLDVLEPINQALVWHLSDTPGPEDGGPSRADILRSLIFQVLRAGQAQAGPAFESMDAAMFQALHSEAEWLQLLCLVLRQLPRCFMLVEADEGAGEMLSVLEDVVSQTRDAKLILKIMILPGNTDLSGSVKLGEQTAILTVQKPAPPPARLRRPRTRQNPRSLAWAGVKKRL